MSAAQESTTQPTAQPTTQNNETKPDRTWVNVAQDGNLVNLEKVENSWNVVGKMAVPGDSDKKSGYRGTQSLKTGSSFAEKDDPKTTDPKTSGSNMTTPSISSSVMSGPYNPVKIIFSRWTIPEIMGHLRKIAGNDLRHEIGSVRIDYFKGTQTDRSIALLGPKLMERLQRTDLQKTGLDIIDYEIRPHWYPHEGSEETSDFFIPLPDQFGVAQCRKGLQEKMDELCKFGIISPDDYMIYIPVEDRESDKHSGRGYIEFKETVPLDKIVLSRCVIAWAKWSSLNDLIPADNNVFIKCFFKKGGPKGVSVHTNSSARMQSNATAGSSVETPLTSGKETESASSSKEEKSSAIQPKKSVINIPTIRVKGSVPKNPKNPFDVLYTEGGSSE